MRTLINICEASEEMPFEIYRLWNMEEDLENKRYDDGMTSLKFTRANNKLRKAIDKNIMMRDTIRKEVESMETGYIGINNAAITYEEMGHSYEIYEDTLEFWDMALLGALSAADN